MKKYNIHPDFKHYCFYVPFNKFIIYLSRFPLRVMWRFTRITKGVELKKIGLRKDKLNIYAFSPKNEEKDLPCLLYFHGGAFAYKAAPYHKKLASFYAKNAHCRVIFPDYSLMPEHVYPDIEKETLKIYKHILKEYKQYGINPENMIVGGDSAGGFLTIDLCHQIFLEGMKSPKAQMLIYPASFSKEATRSLIKYIDTPRWDSKRNQKMWNYYFKDATKEEIESNYLENRDFSNALNTYIEVAEFDPLHDEGIILGELLKKHGNKVTLNETVGTIHGYDMNLKSSITQESVKKRVRFLKENFK